MNERAVDLLRRAAAMRREGRAVAGCLLVKAGGSTPQSAGSLLLVDEAAGVYGTIGGGCVEAELRQRALAMLSAGQTGLVRFTLDGDYGWDDGMICGGTLEVAVAPMPGADRLERIVTAMDRREETALELVVRAEGGPCRYVLPLPPRERLYVAGAGHVGQAAARLGHRLDFEVALFDDRADLLERFTPEGAAPVPGVIDEQLRAAPIDGGTFVLVVTRGHRHDARALAAVVGRGAGYVGMIGSRRKVAMVFEELIARGTPRAALEPVHAPVGVEIGAVTVEEIAVSIAAQLIEVRRGARRRLVEGPLPVAAPSPAAEPSAGGERG